MEETMDTSTKDYTIDAQLLGALGSLWQGTPTGVSPFRYGKTTAPGSEEKAALVAAGVCDAGGQAVPGIVPALDVLGNALAFTRMYITGGPNAYEYIVYFTADGRTASLINIKGDVQINCPSIADLFIEMASQALGSTVYRNATVKASLAPEEALIFAGLVDLQRKEILKALAGSKELPPMNIDPLSVATFLSAGEGNYQWLSNVISELVSGENVVSPQVPAGLASLADKGLVLKTGQACRLSDDAAYLARRMLVIDTSLVLTTGQLAPDGNIGVAGFTCLQAGVHDLLYIDASAGKVEFQAVSSAAVLDYIRAFMTDPEALKKLVIPGISGQPAGASSRKKFCPQCGAQLTEGKKFCPKCGVKIG
jgi:hypothetical protein